MWPGLVPPQDEDCGWASEAVKLADAQTLQRWGESLERSVLAGARGPASEHHVWARETLERRSGWHKFIPMASAVLAPDYGCLRRPVPIGIQVLTTAPVVQQQ